MKTLVLLLAFVVASADLLSADAGKKIEAFQEDIQTAASKRDVSDFLKFFNFTGINTRTQEVIKEEIKDIFRHGYLMSP